MPATNNFAAVAESASNDQKLAQIAVEVINASVGHFMTECKSRGVPIQQDAVKPIYEALAWALVSSSPWLKAALERDGVSVRDPNKRPYQRRQNLRVVGRR